MISFFLIRKISFFSCCLVSIKITMSQSRKTKIDYFQVKYYLKSYSYFYIIDFQSLTSWKNRQRVIDYLSLYEWNLEFAVDGYLINRSNSMNTFKRKDFFYYYLFSTEK